MWDPPMRPIYEYSALQWMQNYVDYTYCHDNTWNVTVREIRDHLIKGLIFSSKRVLR